jgi:hypothetical protein
MVKRAILAALALGATASCTATSVLSKSVYDHEQRAYELRSQGQYDAAAAEEAAAQKDRVKLARIGYSAAPPLPPL